MEDRGKANSNAFRAGVICLILGCLLGLFSFGFLFFVAILFAFVAGILSIVTMVSGSVTKGVGLLIAAIFLPILSSVVGGALFVSAVAANIDRPFSQQPVHTRTYYPAKDDTDDVTEAPAKFTILGSLSAAAVDGLSLSKLYAERVGGNTEGVQVVPIIESVASLQSLDEGMFYTPTFLAPPLDTFFFKGRRMQNIVRIQGDTVVFQPVCSTKFSICAVSPTHVAWTNTRMKQTIKYLAHDALFYVDKLGAFLPSDQAHDDLNWDIPEEEQNKITNVAIMSPTLPDEFNQLNIGFVRFGVPHFTADDQLLVMWDMSYKDLSGKRLIGFMSWYNVSDGSFLKTVQVQKEITDFIPSLRSRNDQYAHINKRGEYIVNLETGIISPPLATSYKDHFSSRGATFFGQKNSKRNDERIVIVNDKGAIISEDQGMDITLEFHDFNGTSFDEPIQSHISSPWPIDKVVWMDKKYMILRSSTRCIVVDIPLQRLKGYFTCPKFLGASRQDNDLLMATADNRNSNVLFYKIK